MGRIKLASIVRTRITIMALEMILTHF